MVIQRDQFVNELLSKRWNGKVKIITGIRRCGKSFLLSVNSLGTVPNESSLTWNSLLSLLLITQLSTELAYS